MVTTIRPDEGRFELALKSLLVLNLLDASCTLWWCLSHLATEANPIMRWALDRGPMVFVGSKVAVVLIGVAVLWRWKWHPLARLGVIPLLAAYAWVVGDHLTEVIELLGQ